MINDLIGKHFKDGGRGPDSYDCYGLLREVYSRYGVSLPDKNVSVHACQVAQGMIDEEVAQSWRRIEKPETPCAVLMRGSAGFAQHIGVYYHGQIIHTDITVGVLVERQSRMKYKIEGYYQYAGYDNIR